MDKIGIWILCVLIGLFFIILPAYADEERLNQCNAIAQVILQDIVTYREGQKPLSAAYSAIDSRKVSKEDAQFQKEVLRVAYEYKTISSSAFSIWAVYNCFVGKTTGQDFPMPIKQYGDKLMLCSNVGVTARRIADARDKGITKDEYLATFQEAQNETRLKGAEGVTRAAKSIVDAVYDQKDLHGTDIELIWVTDCIQHEIFRAYIESEKHKK